jgi:opacity protein-like surface antigen
LVAVLCLLAMPALAAAEDTVDVSGAWEVSWEGRQGMRTVTITFEQDGENLKGSFTGQQGNEVPVTGTVEGDQISFGVTFDSQRGEITLSFKGTVEGDAMSGTMSVAQMERPWTGKKVG